MKVMGAGEGVTSGRASESGGRNPGFAPGADS